MKKNIAISIPDNLSHQEEIFALSKKLMQKSISGAGNNKEILRIGTHLDIRPLQTTITINRVSSEKPITMLHCNVCGCDYQSNTAKEYWHNYGGKKRKVLVCSDKCADNAIDFLGERAAKTRFKLKPIKLF